MTQYLNTAQLCPTVVCSQYALTLHGSTGISIIEFDDVFLHSVIGFFINTSVEVRSEDHISSEYQREVRAERVCGNAHAITRVNSTYSVQVAIFLDEISCVAEKIHSDHGAF